MTRFAFYRAIRGSYWLHHRYRGWYSVDADTYADRAFNPRFPHLIGAEDWGTWRISAIWSFSLACAMVLAVVLACG